MEDDTLENIDNMEENVTNIRDGFNNLNILCIQSRVEKAQQNLFGAQYHHHSEVGGCHNTRPPDIRPPTTEDRPI